MTTKFSRIRSARDLTHIAYMINAYKTCDPETSKEEQCGSFKCRRKIIFKLTLKDIGFGDEK
jgi:hypothetical protein